MEVYFAGNAGSNNFAEVAKDFIEDFGHEVVSTSPGAAAMVVVLTDNDRVAEHEIHTFCTGAFADNPSSAPRVIVFYDEETAPSQQLDQFIRDNDYIIEVCCADESELLDNLATFLEII